MTRVTNCDECNEREPTGFQRDGICRDCRGEETYSRNHRAYVSPDSVERDPEALDHAEARSRRRVVQNDRIQDQ